MKARRLVPTGHSPVTAHTKPAADRPRPRVLIVDDEQHVAVIMGLALYEDGIDIEITTRAEEGLKAALQRRPDAVVLDLVMPGTDGRTVFKEMRRLGIDAPIIIASAFGAERACVELGADGFVAKPFEPDELLATLRGALAGRHVKSTA